MTKNGNDEEREAEVRAGDQRIVARSRRMTFYDTWCKHATKKISAKSNGDRCSVSAARSDVVLRSLGSSLILMSRGISMLHCGNAIARVQRCSLEKAVANDV